MIDDRALLLRQEQPETRFPSVLYTSGEQLSALNAAI